MLRKEYLDAQKKILDSIPMNPFELTQAGLDGLRKNIILSILSMSVLFSLVYLGFSGGFSQIKTIFGDSTAMHLSVLGAYLGALILALYIMSKSTDYVLATGLYWRISVSDELQDEWELEQKRKSYVKAFEYVIYGMGALFLLTLCYCGLFWLIVGSLPQGLGLMASSFLFVTFIFVASMTPLIYLAWTLEPIEDDAATNRTVVAKKPKRDKPLTKREKRLKMLWDYSPYVVGGIAGVWIATEASGGFFHDIGYDLGHWFEVLLRNG